MVDRSHRYTPALEIKLDAAGKVSGYASAWGGPPDAHGDIVQRGAFARTLAELKRESVSPAMLWAHDQSRPIGRWDRFEEDDFGLYAEGTVNLSTEAGREAKAHVDAGDVGGLSIGFMVPPHGQKDTGGGRLITDADLYEVSLVSIPANRRARLNLGSKADLERLLHKSGLPKGAAVKLAAGGWPALLGDDAGDHSRILVSAADRIRRAAATMKG